MPLVVANVVVGEFDDAGQGEGVGADESSRDGFEWALRHACLSSYVRGVHPDRATWQRQVKQAPARVQWDPERDLHLRPLAYRSLQLGLCGEAVRRYADEWTVGISDVTPLAHEVRALVSGGDLDAAARLSMNRHSLGSRVPTADHGHMAAQARR
ncbi:DUF4291 family protein [Streptomyces phaeochromogenes]|uniref:DUF4291 family protein n=1 Tax=Streptomyces phaeochromogenes TaxID=1923 RepID=UPI00099E2793|nr:DUF4291 family protein [Streptomyces phaeochromogenes]